jgi:hypothetical protein
MKFDDFINRDVRAKITKISSEGVAIRCDRIGTRIL